MTDSTFNSDEVIQHLESCLKMKRGDIVMRNREALIHGRGFREYETYFYKEHAHLNRRENRIRA